ncbi:hypothetical protein Taro_011417 [Colocasia esculenta]|uniref:Uncharacterized protein n=1 Tax=Colocasia esculenta TaxID=4460 RepID=A0A843U1F5_COLES|nr:hypothetical protein [Colocasia esculenta]
MGGEGDCSEAPIVLCLRVEDAAACLSRSLSERDDQPVAIPKSWSDLTNGIATCHPRRPDTLNATPDMSPSCCQWLTLVSSVSTARRQKCMLWSEADRDNMPVAFITRMRQPPFCLQKVMARYLATFIRRWLTMERRMLQFDSELFQRCPYITDMEVEKDREKSLASWLKYRVEKSFITDQRIREKSYGPSNISNIYCEWI